MAPGAVKSRPAHVRLNSCEEEDTVGYDERNPDSVVDREKEKQKERGRQ